MPPNPPNPLSSRRLPIVVAIAVLLVYWLVWSGLPHAVDELSALAVSESMLAGDGFTVNQMEWDQARTPPQNAFGLDGNLYSRKGIGVSLAALALWLAGTWWSGDGAVRLALLTGSLLAALAVGCMVWCAQQLGYRHGTALLAGVALGAGTLLFPYARTLFSEAIAGPALMLALACTLAWRATGARSRWLLFTAGVGLAGLTLAKSSNAVITPFFALYFLYETWRAHADGKVRALIKAGLLVGAPLLLVVLATVGYNFMRFGTLAGFPLEVFERFDTPLGEGIIGLLLSAGKGLFWYVPLVLLAIAACIRVLVSPRGHNLSRSDVLVTMLSLAGPLVLYSLWYDWEGGRAWGPRMIAWVMPALVVLALPLLDVATDKTRGPLARGVIWAIVGLSVLVQIPGALVNFEQQEALDMKASASFDALVWQPALSPLLTYWRALFSTALEPVLFQGWTWWYEPIGATLVLVLGAVTVWLLRRHWRDGSQASLWIAALAAVSMGLVLAGATSSDPRWADQSANPEDSRALIAFLEERTTSADLLIFDLQEGRAVQSRAWWRQNALPATPSFVGWLRKPALTDADAAYLIQQWQGSPRTWLVLEETAEGDPASTTEQFMDAMLYRGGTEWLGAQRVVEYLGPAGDEIASGRAVAFGDMMLDTWQLRAGLAEDLWLIELAWLLPMDADMRFSVQALNEAGEVVAQVDHAPGAGIDRVGIDAPDAQRIILKLYNATTGAVAPAPQGDALTLWQAKM